MITEKIKLTKEILEDTPLACGDGGTGHFLNEVVLRVYKGKRVDFRVFNMESWSRARRKVLQDNPQLDTRTQRTKDIQNQYKKEVA
jgi:hypothetical protein